MQVDVANLLTEHKELILKYETIRQGVLALYKPQPTPGDPSSSATEPTHSMTPTEKDSLRDRSGPQPEDMELGERNHARLSLGIVNTAGSQPSSAYPSPPVSIASLDTCNLQLESAHDLALPDSEDLHEVCALHLGCSPATNVLSCLFGRAECTCYCGMILAPKGKEGFLAGHETDFLDIARMPLTHCLSKMLACISEYGFLGCTTYDPHLGLMPVIARLSTKS